jgi:hypothetical protein
MKFALLLVASLLTAQTPRSTEAWAIYNSSSLPKPQQQQFLLEQLKALEPDSQAQYGSPEHALLLLSFDALIQSNLEVPATALEPFARHWPTPVLILLNRVRDPKQLLWKMRGTLRPRAFDVHINNALIRHDPQRLLEALLNEMRLRHRFVVKGKSVQAEWGAFGGGHGHSYLKSPPGFPPIHEYSLTLHPMEGFTVLSSAAQPVFYGRSGLSYFTPQSTPEADRIPVLAKLLNIPLPQLTAHWDRSTTIPWTTPQAFQKQANTFLQTQIAEIQNLLRKARPLCCRIPDTQRLNIQTEVFDYRAPRDGKSRITPPAPGVPPLPLIPAKTFFVFP